MKKKKKTQAIFCPTLRVWCFSFKGKKDVIEPPIHIFCIIHWVYQRMPNEEPHNMHT